MKCPYCGCEESKVTDSRPVEENDSIRRRRECIECGRRFTTYETIESMPFLVIKKNGSRQIFDKNKLIDKMLRACEKRPVGLASLQKIADAVEQRMQNSANREVTTTEIGDMVLAHLRDLDEVAYVRFASVYREFDSVESFMTELKTLKKKPGRPAKTK